MDLKDRPVYSGIVDIAFKNNSPIIPYSSWIPQEHKPFLFASRGVLNDFKYLEKNRKIPYFGRFGAPINPSDFKCKKDLKLFVRDKQLKMEDYLKAL